MKLGRISAERLARDLRADPVREGFGELIVLAAFGAGSPRFYESRAKKAGREAIVGGNRKLRLPDFTRIDRVAELMTQRKYEIKPAFDRVKKSSAHAKSRCAEA